MGRKALSIDRYFQHSKKQAIKNLNQEIKSCRKCGTWRRIKTYGRGSLNARIMLVGQCPWFKPRWAGLPQEEVEKEAYRKNTSFGDRAGEILSKLLKAADINEAEDVFVTNAVRCSQKANKKPTWETTKNCEGFLLREIQIVAPAVVLAASEASRKLFGVRICSSSEAYGYHVEGIYHPSAVLHGSCRFTEYVRHLTTIRERYLF